MRENLLNVMDHDLPPLGKVPTPDRIRAEPWFRESGIEDLLRQRRFKKYAFLGSEIRAHNGKTPPAFGAWLMDEKAGKFDKDRTNIGGTSGNWGTASGLIAPIFDVAGFSAVIEKSVPVGKQHHLGLSGAGIIYSPDGVSPSDYVYELADKEPDKYHLIDQYVHPGSVIGHKWTMDHIARELVRAGDTPTMFGAVTGTCSTIMAAGRYLRDEKFPGLKIFGVASMSEEEKIPGSRSLVGLGKLRKLKGCFRYEEVIDYPLRDGKPVLVASVPRKEVYALNADFYQQYNRSYGPTSVLLEAGYYRVLRDHWEQHGNLGALMNENGCIVMVSYFMDMHLPYSDDQEFLAAFQT